MSVLIRIPPARFTELHLHRFFFVVDCYSYPFIKCERMPKFRQCGAFFRYTGPLFPVLEGLSLTGCMKYTFHP